LGRGMRCARAGEQLAEIEEVHEPAQTVSQQDRRDFRGAVSCRTHPATLVATRAGGDLWPYPPPRAPVDDPNRNDISTKRGTVMRTIEAVRRSAVGIGPERTIREAARMMEEAGVGALAVIQQEQLVGIVTDRDLVRRGLALDLPGDARVDAVMSAPVVTVDADGGARRDAHEPRRQVSARGDHPRAASRRAAALLRDRRRRDAGQPETRQERVRGLPDAASVQGTVGRRDAVLEKARARRFLGGGARGDGDHAD